MDHGSFIWIFLCNMNTLLYMTIADNHTHNLAKNILAGCLKRAQRCVPAHCSHWLFASKAFFLSLPFFLGPQSMCATVPYRLSRHISCWTPSHMDSFKQYYCFVFVFLLCLWHFQNCIFHFTGVFCYDFPKEKVFVGTGAKVTLQKMFSIICMSIRKYY